MRGYYKNSNQIDVIDSGIGIQKDQQPRIFDSFSQQDGQDSRKYGGTGLGLAISYKLCRMMNGTISVDSEVGRGSVFSLFFPNIKAKKSDHDLAKHKNHLPKKINFARAKILIVDDIPLNRDVVKFSLEKQTNLSFFEAATGRQAIPMARDILPDLIIIDLRMPEMSGIEAAEAMKKDAQLQNIPLCIYTATVHGENLDIFDAVLFKPVKKIELMNVLKKFIKWEVSEEALGENALREKPKPLSFFELETNAFFDKLNERDHLRIQLKKEFVPLLPRLILLKDQEEILLFLDNLNAFLQDFNLPDWHRAIANLREKTEYFDYLGIEKGLSKLKDIFSSI